MSTTVRLYALSGLTVLPVAANNNLTVTSSEFMWKQRYLAREVLTASNPATVSSAALSVSDSVKMLVVQVQPGGRVHYEVYGPNESPVTADTSSPVLDGGDNYVEFYRGWSISVLECTEVSVA